MTSDDQPRRPPGASRARTGGSARPVGDGSAGPRADGAARPVNDGAARPGETGRRPLDPRRPRAAGPVAASTPAAAPPSIAPAGGGSRPAPGAEPILVGRPTRPVAPARPAGSPPARSVGPLAAGPLAAEAEAAPGTTRPALPLGPGRSATSARPPILPPERTRRPGARRKRVALIAVVVVLALLAWPIGLLIWANGKIQHVDALSTAANTPGTTYLIAGSDSRGGAGGIAADGTQGARTDTILLLQVPPSGPAALISLPRDTYAKIPGRGASKLNAAYSWGGAPLLVQTVEQLTGLRVDQYVEIGLGGVAQVVDAVGGVQLCLDPKINLVKFPLNDKDSGLKWDAPGCKLADGATALAFTRMRKADREGDIGRAKRQQQLIAALSSAVATPSLVFAPGRQVTLISTGLGALQVSRGTDIVDLGRLALAFRRATGPAGIRGTPPILSADYRPGHGAGSTVELDPAKTPAFFTAIMNGTLPPGPVGGLPGG